MRMELDIEKEKNEGHKQIATALKDLGDMGYRVKGISVNGDGVLDITCHCPQVNEGSRDGISDSVNWVDLSNNSGTTEKAQ
jgi:hypothetical protein